MLFRKIIVGMVFTCSTNFAFAKQVLSQNSCLAFVEAHSKQSYNRIYIKNSDYGFTEAKVLFKNENTWQVQLKKNCDKNLVGQNTYGYLPEVDEEPEEKKLTILTKRPIDPEARRARRKSRSGFGAGAEFGFAFSQIPSFGIHGKYILDSSFRFRLFFRSGATQEGTSAISINELGLGAEYHQFSWGYYSLQLKRTATEVAVRSNLQSYDTKKISYGLGLGVGSSFDWKSVQLSCEWITFNLSLYATETSTFKPDSKTPISKAVDPEKDYSLGSFTLLLMQSTFIF